MLAAGALFACKAESSSSCGDSGICASRGADAASDAGEGAGGASSNSGGKGGSGASSSGGERSSGGRDQGDASAAGGTNGDGGANSGGANSGGANSGGAGASSAGATASGGQSGAGGHSTMVGNGTWTKATGNLADLPSECGNMSDLAVHPEEDMLIAGVAQKGLWASMDGGKTWKQLGVGGASITNRTSAVVFDPTDSKHWWESGIYNGNGVYFSGDDGSTFSALGSVTHVDLVSIDFTDPARKTLLAGGHEQSRALYLSTDGGQNWNNVGTGLPDQTNCSYPLVMGAQEYLVGCAGYGGGPTGIYRTTDGAKNWSVATSSGGVGAPLVASDHAIYWASPSSKGMAKSTDGGQHWTDVNVAAAGFRPTELPDGRIATVANDVVVLSADHGATWSTATDKLPYAPNGLVYSSKQKAFFVWHFSCGNPPVPVPDDAIERFEFDYTTH